MLTLYQRSLGLSAVVLVVTIVAVALAAASTAANRQRLGALGVREAVDEAALAVSELIRTRDLAFADSAAIALQRGTATAQVLPAADAASVWAELTAYEEGVTRLRSAIEARGTDEESGEEGRFRARVHAVEEWVDGGAPILLLPVLQARRREKDFLLRGDSAYVPMVQAHVADAQRAARASLAPAEADTVAALLREYEAGFLDLVRLVGMAEAEASQIAREGQAVQRVVGPIAASAGARARRLGTFSLVGALLSALVVGVAVVFQARGVTRPVARLGDAAARVARGETSVRVPVEGPDEIRTLAAALNGVADYAERTVAAEHELAETQRFLATALGRAEEGIVVLDSSYRVTYANPYAERLYGTTLGAVQGLRPDELYRYVDEADRRGHFERALGGEVVHAADLEVVVGGRAVWIASTYAPLPAEDGDARGVVVTVHDVSNRVATERELRAAKEAAETAARLKSSLLANMSHEIRTPLTAILGYAEMLADEAPPGLQDLVEPIWRGGRRLMDTLNSVLDLAQIEAGEVAVSAESVDLLAEVDETCAAMRPLALAKGLDLQVVGLPVWALADRPAFGRVLTNMVGNAVKFTDCGSVTVEVGQDGKGGWVRVSDTGVGIAAEFLPALFSEFKQESEGHGRAYEGNGLGLAITKRLVDLMGGEIAVESVKGVGSVFTVCLPLASEDVQARGS